ncbi:hypothetical protein [Kineococcus glutinatus]|uniref:HutD protein n=1 Tax=Kineococcus glutinatus TaxID=1070872 RepID=A0ABP9HQG5_9ACTN
MAEVDPVRSGASGAGWLVEVAVSVDTEADPAPVVTVNTDGIRPGTTSPTIAMRVVGGEQFPVAVDLSDPCMAAWSPDAHPALQRKLWHQRTIWRPHLQVEPARIEVDGLLAIATDGSGRSGYERQPGDPRPALDATGGCVAAIEGWQVLLLRPAAASFTLSAPAWWGPTGEITGPADGTVTATVTLRRAAETATT